MISSRDEYESGTITGFLAGMRNGCPRARERLFEHIYQELRKIAHSILRTRRGSDLDTTALANTACERLLNRTNLDAENRRHFFFQFKRAMIDVVTEQTRAIKSQKRGGGRQRVPLTQVNPTEKPEYSGNLDLCEALSDLKKIDEVAARVVELLYIEGRSFREVAEDMNCTLAAVRNRWAYARSWLHHRLST